MSYFSIYVGNTHYGFSIIHFKSIKEKEVHIYKCIYQVKIKLANSISRFLLWETRRTFDRSLHSACRCCARSSLAFLSASFNIDQESKLLARNKEPKSQNQTQMLSK